MQRRVTVHKGGLSLLRAKALYGTGTRDDAHTVSYSRSFQV